GLQVEPRGLRLDARQAPQIAAPDPGDPQRHKRLQQGPLPLGTEAPRAACDEADAPVADGQAFEQLARIAVGALVKNVAPLEQGVLAIGHCTSKPSLPSSRSLSDQCSRTLTHSSRCTL